MMRYEIVPMDRSHLESIAALERQCFSAPWSIPMREGEVFNPQARVGVGGGENGPGLGYAGLQVVLDEGYIANIAVDPKWRRQGLAGELLEVYCRFAQAHLAFLTLEVRASNEAAIALYVKHGFVQAGVRKNYYQDPKEDALIMTREFHREGEA